MMFAHDTDNQSIIWVLLLALALLATQGTRLHVHFFDCEPSALTPSDHGTRHAHPQHARIHLVSDASQHTHTLSELSELDVSPQGLLTKTSHIPIMLPALSFVFTLLPPAYFRLTGLRQPQNAASLPWRYILSPPLRAPPRD